MILEPILLRMKHGISISSNPILQIIQIKPSNIFKTKFTIRLSDGDYWIETKLNSDFTKLISEGVFKTFDVIKIKEYTGNVCDETFNIIKMGIQYTLTQIDFTGEIFKRKIF